MKDRSRPSMKELNTNENSTKETYRERWPNYLTKPPKFYCPIGGSEIMWHHDLMYKSCPVNASQRDMPACEKCIHKGSKQQSKSNVNVEEQQKSSEVVPVKTEKTAIPTIGKTYNSE